MTRIKICCIADVAEAEMALRLGADVLGLVAPMPSGPGTLPDDAIAAVLAGLDRTVTTFLLTPRTGLGELVDHHARCPATALQLVDRVEPAVHTALAERLPGVKRVQVIHVTGEVSVAEARELGAAADFLLLDSGNPALAVKELGGTGRVHDWDLSARIVREAPVPVFLAGGLHADNVAEAVRRVRPHGVDVCGGVRVDGRLDEDRLRRFVAAVRRA